MWGGYARPYEQSGSLPQRGVKCHERAKSHPPPSSATSIGISPVRYLFMAEDASRRAEEEGRTVERTAMHNIECGSEREDGSPGFRTVRPIGRRHMRSGE